MPVETAVLISCSGFATVGWSGTFQSRAGKPEPDILASLDFSTAVTKERPVSGVPARTGQVESVQVFFDDLDVAVQPEV
jgi:hypothetical protein